MKFVEMLNEMRELSGINEARKLSGINEARKRKAAFGYDGKMAYAVKIGSFDNNEFFKLPYGHQRDYYLTIIEFRKTAKKDYVDAKGKSTMAAVKRWVKEVQPSEFYARWEKDSPMSKSDSVEIFYKK